MEESESDVRESGGRKTGIVERWRRFRRLPPAERRLTAFALVALPVVEVGLRALGARRLLSLLERTLPEPAETLAESDVERERAFVTARRIAAAARWGVVSSTCLRQAILLWWLLRRRRIECSIRFGVSRTSQQLAAHAWVESGSVVVEPGNAPDRRFVALREQPTAEQGHGLSS